MKNVYKKILFLISAVVMMVAFNMNVNASAPALTKSADDIANQTFIIGSHAFELASDEPMTMQAIQDATRTIPLPLPSTIFYKDYLGEWAELNGTETDIPATFTLTKINGKVVVDEAEALAEAIEAAEELLEKVEDTLRDYLVVIEEDDDYTNALELVNTLTEYIASETANTASILAQIEVLEGVLEDLEAAILALADDIIAAANVQLDRVNPLVTAYSKYDNSVEGSGLLGIMLDSEDLRTAIGAEEPLLAAIKNNTNTLKLLIDALEAKVDAFEVEITAAIALLVDANATLAAYTAAGGSDSALTDPVSSVAPALDGALYSEPGVLLTSFDMAAIRAKVEALTDPTDPADPASLSVLEVLKEAVDVLQTGIITAANAALNAVEDAILAYTDADGDDEALVTAVEAAEAVLRGLLDVEYDYAEIITKTGELADALEALEDATTVLDATALLESVQDHLAAYLAAGGLAANKVYTDVTSAESALETELEKDPVIINDIETAVGTLETALVALDAATEGLLAGLATAELAANALLLTVQPSVDAYKDLVSEGFEGIVDPVMTAKGYLETELANSARTVNTVNGKIVALQDALDNLHVATVIAMIENLDNDPYVYEDVLAAFAAYNELDSDLKVDVTNFSDLETALESIFGLYKVEAMAALGVAYSEYDLNDYSTPNQVALTTAKTNGLTAIDNAATVVLVDVAYNAAIEAMKAVETLAEELAAEKATAVTAIENAYVTYNSADYSEDNQAALLAAKDAGIANVNAVTIITEVDQARQDALDAMAAILTIAQETEAELAAAKVAAQAILDTEYESYTETDYEGGDWTTLVGLYTTGTTAIDEATTVALVDTALQTALDGMAEVETKDQTLANAKTAATKAITDEYDLYVDVAADYSAANWILLGAAKDEGLLAVAAATTTAAVTEAQSAAITAMAKVETLLVEAKAAAVEVLDAAYEGYAEENYLASNWTDLHGAYTTGGATIGAATTVAGVEEALQTALDGMAEVRNSDQSYTLAGNISALINTLPAIIKTSNEALIEELEDDWGNLTTGEKSLILNHDKLTTARSALDALLLAIEDAETLLAQVSGAIDAWITDGGTQLDLYWAVITAKQDLLEAIDAEVTGDINAAKGVLESALSALSGT